KSRDLVAAIVSLQRANVRRCVPIGSLIPRTEWLRPRLRSDETSALQTARLCPPAHILGQGDRALVERVMPPIRARIDHLRSSEWIARRRFPLEKSPSHQVPPARYRRPASARGRDRA